jgi:hypothetical protein
VFAVKDEVTLLELSRSICKGADFLLCAQDCDGAWRDFNLRPGRADAWTTAYVGMRLAPLRREGKPDRVAAALASAVQFLHGVRLPHGGWAYNRRCPPDADSTACALLFLGAVAGPIQAKDIAALARFHVDGGGFATYSFGGSEHGWCRPHPEVTATALRALSAALARDHVRIRGGLAWLTARLRPESPCSSYWWLSPHYLAVEVERLRQIFPALPGYPVSATATKHESAFEQALLLEWGLLRRTAPAALWHSALDLVRFQRDDGSWGSSPMLRVPDPRVRALSAISTPCGHTAVDAGRKFTTATVVAALNSTVLRVARGPCDGRFPA